MDHRLIFAMTLVAGFLILEGGTATISTSGNATFNTFDVQPLATNITNAMCGQRKLCLTIPTSCDPAGSAPCLFASASISSQGNLFFELRGISNVYIVLGLSSDSSLQNGFMFACGQMNGNASFLYTNNSLNPNYQYQVVSASGSVSGNVLQCTFQVSGLTSSILNFFTQINNLYVFLATGNIINGMSQSSAVQLFNTSSIGLINMANLITFFNNLLYVPISTQPLTASITNATCGQKKLCLSTPTSCDPAGSASCLFASASMSWQGNLVFELRGNSSGYIALGLSTVNPTLNSVVFACAQQNGSIFLHTFLLKDSILSNFTSYPVVSALGSVSGNVIQCTIQVSGLNSVILNSVTQTKNLYSFLATGSITNGIPGLPVVQLVNTDFFGLMNMANFITFFNNLLYAPMATQPLTTSITRTTCGNSKLCVATPVLCNPAGSTPCLFASITNTSSLQNTNVTIELRGDSSGYVAVGGSLTQSTQNSIVYACAQQNGSIFVYTFQSIDNILYQSTLYPVLSALGSVSGNVIQCTFQVYGLSSLVLGSGHQIRDLYAFLANGSITNGILQAPVIQLSPTSLNSNSVIPIPTLPLTTSITSTNCGKTKLCLRTPNGCNPAGSSECLFASSATSSQGIMTFELRGQSNGYIALGLSTANTTQYAIMFACAQLSGTVSLFSTKLINSSVIQDSSISVDNIQGTQNGNVIRCTFNTAGLSSTASKIRALNTTFFVFLATGDVNNGTLQAPVIKLQPVLVDLANATVNLFSSSPPIHSYSALLILLSVVPFQLF
uniref:Uncharacterized LOC108937868 n=1 Tax=Scleropages formosus TaxID=113540 RepID=A0A8C9U765_SCLFO